MEFVRVTQNRGHLGDNVTLQKTFVFHKILGIRPAAQEEICCYLHHVYCRWWYIALMEQKRMHH